jgi:hypothetical protein
MPLTCADFHDERRLVGESDAFQFQPPVSPEKMNGMLGFQARQETILSFNIFRQRYACLFK